MSANTVNFKPSFGIESLLSENLREDSENFVLFLRAYYEWLQTSTIELSGISGTFQRDEIISGGTTKASAIVKEVKTSSIVVRMRTEKPFKTLETITGATSSATATISGAIDNVVRKTGQLLNYRDVTKTVDKYVEYLKRELYSTFSNTSVANKELVAKKYRDFLENKGNEESYKFLFRAIYNEEVELKYPSEEILRVSDGNFEKTQIIRAAITTDEQVFSFLNQTIVGEDSGSVGNVIDIKLIYVGNVRVAEMTLVLVSGGFDAGEKISILNQATSNTTIYGMITDFIINDAGSGYNVGDELIITGDGEQAKALISSIKSSPITSIKINSPGYGYRQGINASVVNTGTGGSDFAVRVTEIANTYTTNGYTVGDTATISIINRGSGYYSAPTITLVDTVIQSLGLLSENLISIANGGISYAVGDALVFTGGSGANAAGRVASVNESTTYDLLFEDGFRMLADGSYRDIVKNEDWNVTGAITRLELTNFGSGYTSANLPVITVTSGTGSSANLIATGIQGTSANVTVDIANNATGIGSIRAIEIKNFGVNYTTANVNLTGVGDGNANVTPVITGLGISEGNWIDDDGKIDYKILQDSYYYQDFSYVIRSGLQFNQYADMVKQIVHPAGLQFFGEILLVSEIDVAPVFTSTIETLANINKYIYTIIFEADASAPGDTASEVMKELEYFVQGQTQIYTAFERINVIVPYVDVAPIFSSTVQIIENINKYIVYLKSIIGTTSSYNSTENKLVVEKTFNLFEHDPISGNKRLIGDALISEFSSNTISLLASLSFIDVFGSGLKSITKNVRVTGTANVTGNNVVGTGTTFNTDFSIGDSIIIGSEKFIVSNVANSTSILLNVPATVTYTGTNAYKEVTTT